MKLKLISIVIMSFTYCGVCPGQTQMFLKPLSIGDKVPEKIWETIPKTDKTKLVILDQWYTGCASCIAAFPKMDSLQKQFADKIKIVLTTFNTEQEINDRIEKSRIRTKTGLTSIAGDKIFIALFPCESYPQHVWIDSERVVRGITHGHNTTAKNIQYFLDNKNIVLEKKADKFYDLKKSLAENKMSVENNRALYHSEFTGYLDLLGPSYQITQDSLQKNYFFLNWDIISLYNIVFDKAFKRNEVFLNVKDSGRFIEDQVRVDNWQRRGLFCYELSVPGDLSEESVHSIMQEDLNRYLRLYGKPETKTVKVYVLIKTGSIKLPVRYSGDILKESEDDPDILFLHNASPADLALQWNSMYGNDYNRPILVDETGVTDKIPIIKIPVQMMKDVRLLRDAIKTYGLDIIEAERQIELLVISDGNQD